MGSIGLGLLGRPSLRLPCEQNTVTPQQLLRQANHRSHCSCLHPRVAPSKARAGRVPPCKAGEESAAWVETVPQETTASSDVSQQTPSIIDAMQDVVNLFVTRQLESIVSYLSIEQVVRAAVMQQTRARDQEQSAYAQQYDHQGQVLFLHVLDATYRDDPDQALLDSYAIRHLLLSQPSNLLPVSTLHVGDKLIQRFLVKSATGEECILTFTLSPRSESESKLTYSRMKSMQPWVLHSVRGEAASPLPATDPRPEHPPELVVDTFLEALRDCDMNLAYSFTSLLGRSVAGGGGPSRFYQLLKYDPRYQAVLMHSHAKTLRQCHSHAHNYVQVVNITDASGASALYCVVAALQVNPGDYQNCWMVDYMQVINDGWLQQKLQHY